MTVAPRPVGRLLANLLGILIVTVSAGCTPTDPWQLPEDHPASPTAEPAPPPRLPDPFGPLDGPQGDGSDRAGKASDMTPVDGRRQGDG